MSAHKAKKKKVARKKKAPQQQEQGRQSGEYHRHGELRVIDRVGDVYHAQISDIVGQDGEFSFRVVDSQTGRVAKRFFDDVPSSRNREGRSIVKTQATNVLPSTDPDTSSTRSVGPIAVLKWFREKLASARSDREQDWTSDALMQTPSLLPAGSWLITMRLDAYEASEGISAVELEAISDSLEELISSSLEALGVEGDVSVRIASIVPGCLVVQFFVAVTSTIAINVDSSLWEMVGLALTALTFVGVGPEDLWAILRRFKNKLIKFKKNDDESFICTDGKDELPVSKETHDVMTSKKVMQALLKLLDLATKQGETGLSVKAEKRGDGEKDAPESAENSITAEDIRLLRKFLDKFDFDGKRGGE